MTIGKKLTGIATALVLVASSVVLGGASALPAPAPDAPETEQSATETEQPAPEAEVPAPEAEVPAPEAEVPATETEQPAATTEQPSAAKAEQPTAQAEQLEDAAEPGALAGQPGALWASMDLSRVTLSDGAVMGTSKGFASGVKNASSGSTKDVYSVTGSYDDDSATGLDVTVVHKIHLDIPNAPEEDFWLVTRLYEQALHGRAECAVYTGDPRAGGTIKAPAPYVCSSAQTQYFPNLRYTFHVELNRYVESSGTITTQGPVSLAASNYTFELPYRLAGSDTVGLNSSTTFGTVMRESDHPDTGTLALTRFSYRIQETRVVDGKPTQVDTNYWLAGRVSRDRPGNNQSWCRVFDVDPSSTTAWDSVRVPVAAPFACSATGHRVDSGHYDGEISVFKRDVTVIPATDRPRQTDIYASVCATHAENCDLRLATASVVSDDWRAEGDVWGNWYSEESIEHKFITESKRTITNSFGTEVTLGIEGDAFGQKFKMEITEKYKYEIATETTKTDEQSVTVKWKDQAFIEGAPSMVHTEGDIYVWRDNRLFLLEGVVADFPLAGNKWNFRPVTEAIPNWKPRGGLGGVDGGTTNPPLESLDPAAAAAAAAAASVKGGTAGGGKALAQTGTSLDSIVPIGLVGTGLALMGGLFLVLRRRRQQHN